MYWLPASSDRYLPYGKKDWEGLKSKSVRLT
jgi:hypothetical protein